MKKHTNNLLFVGVQIGHVPCVVAPLNWNIFSKDYYRNMHPPRAENAVFTKASGTPKAYFRLYHTCNVQVEVEEKLKTLKLL